LSVLAVALAVAGGLCGSVQVAVMGRFGGRVGVLEALAFSTAIQLVLSIGVLLAARGGGIGGLRNVGSTPVWMWIGGLMGFTVVTSITFAQPRLGATAVIGILIAGQLVMGAVIDRFGLFGVQQIAISPARAVGIVLLGIGAGLSLVR
jgi:transporter family-2 protein